MPTAEAGADAKTSAQQTRKAASALELLLLVAALLALAPLLFTIVSACCSVHSLPQCSYSPPVRSASVDLSGYGTCAVANIQVGLSSAAVSLKKDLEGIAKRADTNNSAGVHFLLQETVLALLRHPEYCQYGAAQAYSAWGLDATEQRFNEVSMQERSKFKEETLVNVSGRTRNTSDQGKYGDQDSAGDELIVVTILVAASCSLSLGKVSSQDSLRTALNCLGALRPDQVLAAEVMWTSQDEDDVYTRDEMTADYPQLYML